MANSRLNQVLDNWKDWPLNLDAKPRVCQQLSGFTNQSHVLDVGNRQLVLRLNRPNSISLGIDRAQEYQIWQRVADLGIAPQPLLINGQQNFVIYQYLQGRVWTSEDFKSPAQLKRLAGLVSTYQQANIDLPARNYIDYLSHYWKQLDAASAITPELNAEWNQFLPELEVFQRGQWSPVISHHDLIPENIIDNGQQLYIVDWEYAALGHPELDWSTVTGEKTSDISKVIHWINRLWWLLADASQGFNTGI